MGALIWALSSSAAFAVDYGSSKVIRVGSSQSGIAVSHPTGSQWIIQDRVCVIQIHNPIGCGKVLKTTNKGAIVKLDAPNSDIVAGDSVVPESQASSPPPKTVEAPMTVTKHKKSQNRPTLLLDSMKKNGVSENYLYNFSAGANFSFSFFYPTVTFEYLFHPQFSIGITPMVLFAKNSGVNLMGWGGFLDLNYYHQGNFRGIWLRGAAGYINFAVSSSTNPNITESAGSMMGLATIGWRGYWDLGLNIGVSAGGQYIQDPHLITISVDSAGIQPVLTLDVGFNW